MLRILWTEQYKTLTPILEYQLVSLSIRLVEYAIQQPYENAKDAYFLINCEKDISSIKSKYFSSCFCCVMRMKCSATGEHFFYFCNTISLV